MYEFEAPLKPWEQVLTEKVLSRYEDKMRHASYYTKVSNTTPHSDSHTVGTPDPRVLSFLQEASDRQPHEFALEEANRSETIRSRISVEETLYLQTAEEMRTFLQAVEFAEFNRPFVSEKNGAVMTPEKFILRRLFLHVESQLIDTRTTLHYTRSFLDEGHQSR